MRLTVTGCWAVVDVAEFGPASVVPAAAGTAVGLVSGCV